VKSLSDILVLHLKGIYYDQIKCGAKTVEYRDMTAYWLSRITKDKRLVHFYKGYPPRGTVPLVKKIKGITVNSATEQIKIHLE